MSPIFPHRNKSISTIVGFAVFALMGVALANAATVDIFPGTNIPNVVSTSPSGTTFVIHPGVYRLQAIINPKDGDVFSGPCGKPPCAASSQAILSGSKVLTSFPQSNGFYTVTGQTQQGTVTISSAECEPGYEGCANPEDLYFDGNPLDHVTSLSAVDAGKWYFDYAGNTIYFVDNPSGHTVETSVLPSAFAPGPANNVTIQGLTIEEFATPVMTGAVAGAWTGYGSTTQGANWVVQNNEIRRNHADGIRLNFGWRVLNNYVHHNGNLAIGGGIGGGNADGSGTQASNILIQGNELSYNNYARFRPAWGGAGSKVLQTRGIIFRGNYSHNNSGPGFHTDTANYNAVYENNIDADNTREGLMHEISYAALVRNNKLLRNGYTSPNNTDWLYAGNLVSSTSQGVEAYCNTVEVSATGGNGIDILTQQRTGYIPSINNYYHHNTVFFDGNSGVTGAARGEPTNATEQNFFTANHFDYNTYHLPNLSRSAFAWNDKNMTFAAFQAAGQDTHGSADTKYTSSIPNVSITSPATGQTLQGIATVTGNASDTSTISKVEFYVDWSLVATTGGSAFSFSWDTTDVAAGQHTLVAMAYNSQGVRTCYGITANTTGAGGGGTIKNETKNLTASGVPDARLFAWSGFPNGTGTILDANKVGNSIAFTVNVPKPGTYDIKYSSKKFASRGIAQLSINGAKVGPTVDQYSSNAAGVYQEFDLGNFTFSTAGNYQFNFAVTGKNASSNGYLLAFDYIDLTLQ